MILSYDDCDNENILRHLNFHGPVSRVLFTTVYSLQKYQILKIKKNVDMKHNPEYLNEYRISFPNVQKTILISSCHQIYILIRTKYPQ